MTIFVLNSLLPYIKLTKRGITSTSRSSTRERGIATTGGGGNNIDRLQVVGNWTQLSPKIIKNCRKVWSRDPHCSQPPNPDPDPFGPHFLCFYKVKNGILGPRQGQGRGFWLGQVRLGQVRLGKFSLGFKSLLSSLVGWQTVSMFSPFQWKKCRRYSLPPADV